jgi:subtilisin family serine protease
MKTSFILGSLFLFSQTGLAAINPITKTFVPQRPSITVAIIDTGTDINHTHLKSNLWINKGEQGLDSKGQNKATNNLDDDDNGYVDDLHGWNFVDNNNDLSDSMGHGTHISGVVKNESDRSSSLNTNSTFTQTARLMILKYYNPEGTDVENIKNTVKAMNYAVKMKADIINYSGGGSLPNELELKALKLAEKSNIMVVAAAGNNKTNTDISSYYPANYGLKNIISVAAVEKSGELVAFSNYGAKTVDIAAPGRHVFSTLPQNKFGYMSGTSQSTAFVSGRLAFIMSRIQKKNPDFLLNKLLEEAEFNKTLAGKTKFQVALTSVRNANTSP